MTSLFDSGVRPAIDAHLLELAQEKRNYGDYWSASSAGYCQRKVIFERLGVPYVETEADGRKQRIFTAGHLFHDWIQGITKEAGLSVASEVELQDEELMVRGHFDDLVTIDNKLILYDYKTQNSRAFNYKRPEMSYYHRLQLGTYMHMIRKMQGEIEKVAWIADLPELNEARILKISKDDLRMNEEQLMWDTQLESEVLSYWDSINKHWKLKTLPPCTCADREGGFLAKPKYNPYYYNDTPCSLEWYELKKKEGEVLT